MYFLTLPLRDPQGSNAPTAMSTPAPRSGFLKPPLEETRSKTSLQEPPCGYIIAGSEAIWVCSLILQVETLKPYFFFFWYWFHDGFLKMGGRPDISFSFLLGRLRPEGIIPLLGKEPKNWAFIFQLTREKPLGHMAEDCILLALFTINSFPFSVTKRMLPTPPRRMSLHNRYQVRWWENVPGTPDPWNAEKAFLCLKRQDGYLHF